MNRGRLEAFSDGVIAIIITIMVLELKVPHGTSYADLAPMFPIFLSYLLSFVYVGIYWTNHHHMFQTVEKVDGLVLWANLHLLFWLSLVPFVTTWAGENHFQSWPTALYGVNLLFAALAYYLLTLALRAGHDEDSNFTRALGSDFKGKISMVIYLVGILLAFWNPALGGAFYVIVAIMWIIPDRRYARQVEHSAE